MLGESPLSNSEVTLGCSDAAPVTSSLTLMAKGQARECFKWMDISLNTQRPTHTHVASQIKQSHSLLAHFHHTRICPYTRHTAFFPKLNVLAEMYWYCQCLKINNRTFYWQTNHNEISCKRQIVTWTKLSWKRVHSYYQRYRHLPHTDCNRWQVPSSIFFCPHAPYESARDKAASMCRLLLQGETSARNKVVL